MLIIQSAAKQPAMETEFFDIRFRVLNSKQHLRPYLSNKLLASFPFWTGGSVSEEDFVSLSKEADKFTLVSHLHWGLWGVIFSASSNIEFDYADYSRQRFRQYFLSKDGLLAGDPRLPGSYGSRS